MFPLLLQEMKASGVPPDLEFFERWMGLLASLGKLQELMSCFQVVL
jgi:hypothetical protein